MAALNNYCVDVTSTREVPRSGRSEQLHPIIAPCDESRSPTRDGLVPTRPADKISKTAQFDSIFYTQPSVATSYSLRRSNSTGNIEQRPSNKSTKLLSGTNHRNEGASIIVPQSSPDTGSVFYGSTGNLSSTMMEEFIDLGKWCAVPPAAVLPMSRQRDVDESLNTPIIELSQFDFLQQTATKDEFKQPWGDMTSQHSADMFNNLSDNSSIINSPENAIILDDIDDIIGKNENNPQATAIIYGNNGGGHCVTSTSQCGVNNITSISSNVFNNNNNDIISTNIYNDINISGVSTENTTSSIKNIDVPTSVWEVATQNVSLKLNDNSVMFSPNSTRDSVKSNEENAAYSTYSAQSSPHLSYDNAGNSDVSEVEMLPTVDNFRDIYDSDHSLHYETLTNVPIKTIEQNSQLKQEKPASLGINFDGMLSSIPPTNQSLNTPDVNDFKGLLSFIIGDASDAQIAFDTPLICSVVNETKSSSNSSPYNSSNESSSDSSTTVIAAAKKYSHKRQHSFKPNDYHEDGEPFAKKKISNNDRQVSKNGRKSVGKKDITSTRVKIENEINGKKMIKMDQTPPVAKRGRPPKRTQSIASSLDNDDSDGSRYRELRDKNNEASRRSRINRKKREAEMEDQAKQLERDNVVLTAKVEELEKLVSRLRESLLHTVLKSNK